MIDANQMEIRESGGLYGLYDQEGGMEVIPCVYEHIEIHMVGSEGGGKEAYALVVREGRYGVLDLSGSMLIPMKFASLYPFEVNHGGEGWLLMAERNGRKGVIRFDGSYVLEVEYDSIELFDVVVRKAIGDKEVKYFLVGRDGLKGLMTVDGEEAIRLRYDDISICVSGPESSPKYYIKVMRRGFEGIRGINARPLIPCVYDEVRTGDYYFVIAVRRAGIRFYSYDGYLLVDGEYAEILDFHEGLAAVRTDEGWGFIDTTGRMVIPPRYGRVRSFENGIAPVQRRQRRIGGGRGAEAAKWGFIAPDGRQVEKYEFIEVEDRPILGDPGIWYVTSEKDGQTRIRVLRNRYK